MNWKANDSAMLDKEPERIKTRRTLAQVEAGNPLKDAKGLALSGGGIRSASFNLGVLQALARTGMFKKIDYLSTVSGGGYIGSSLTWFMSVMQQAFPYGTSRRDNSGSAGDIVAWIRTHGNYLIPGQGLTLWALLGAILTGAFATLAVLVPVFMWLVWWLSRGFGHDAVFPPLLSAIQVNTLSMQTGYTWLVASGFWLLEIFVLFAFIYALLTQFPLFRIAKVQNFVRIFMGYTLMLAVATLVLGSLPCVYGFLTGDWLATWMSSVSLTGVISFVVGLWKPKPGTEATSGRSLLLTLGLVLFIYGLFLWFYHLLGQAPTLPVWLKVILLLSLALAVLANINHVSMHRFYRNRLMEAFMPRQWRKDDAPNPDSYPITKTPQTAAPYHIVNTNVQLTGSANSKYRVRAGDNFIFSPLWCGSNATGFCETKHYLGGSMNLPTAMAISGAAVDPNTYMTRSKPLTFVMTLFNIRLGYWTRNPKHPAKWLKGLSRPRWYRYLFTEMFLNGLNEESPHIHLSDGGHFENLGLYELVRRRCSKIIVSDAGADPKFSFEDLARVIELIRVDFGAKVELDVAPLIPGQDGRAAKGWVKGSITYATENENETPMVAELFYIKSTLTQGLQEDIYGYQRKHKDFPDETTGDQFFDEFQFEAYRELGYQIAKDLVL